MWLMVLFFVIEQFSIQSKVYIIIMDCGYDVHHSLLTFRVM